MKDCIAIDQLGNCLAAVTEVTGFDVNSATCRIPSLVLEIGHALEKKPKVLKQQTVEDKRYDELVHIDCFHDLCHNECADKISKHALDTFNQSD